MSMMKVKLKNIEKNKDVWLKVSRFEDIYLADEEYTYTDKNTGEVITINSDDFCKLFVAYGLYLKIKTPPLNILSKNDIDIYGFVKSTLKFGNDITDSEKKIIEAVRQKIYDSHIIEDIDGIETEYCCQVFTDRIFKYNKNHYKVIYPFEFLYLLSGDNSYDDKLNLIKVLVCLKSNLALRVNKPDTEYVFTSIKSNATLAAMCNMSVKDFQGYMKRLVQELPLFREYQFVNDETGMKHTLYCEYDNPNYKRDFKYAEEFILNGVNNKEKSNSKNINSFADIASNHSAIDNIPIPVRKCKVS